MGSHEQEVRRNVENMELFTFTLVVLYTFQS